MIKQIRTMSEDMLCRVSLMILRDGMKMEDVMRWLRANGYPTANRTWPRMILIETHRRGLITLPLRESTELMSTILHNSGVQCRVAAVENDDRNAFETVAELAADQVRHLIFQVHAAGQDTDPPNNNVHIGLAAGGTSREFASHLLRLLHEEEKLPQLWLHTLTSSFFVESPENAPVVSLGQFSTLEPRPRFVILLSNPLVTEEEAKRLRERPFTRDAFKAARKLDIVVTSVSVAHHKHGLFQRAITEEDRDLAAKRIARLDQQGWAGDIMWQPYSSEGKPIECDVQAASVVDFGRLVRLSRASSKHVVCIAGPCAVCGQPKDDAIIPLMSCPTRRRPFNHLVTTQSTAKAICDAFGW